MLQPIWHANRRKLLVIHGAGLAAFVLIWFGVMDPARLSQYPFAYFTFFATTLVALGEAIMIWQISAARSSSDDSAPYWIEPRLNA
jgi:hypothetical protein